MEKVSRKLMRCPTCGAKLKAENSTDVITCVYCGNTVVPVAESATNERNTESTGVLRVEGIKTSSSALAYIEQFFEEYDWESFSYAQSLSIYDIDKLANSLCLSSADDKNTWLACFTAIQVPFAKKLEGCKKILELAVSQYKQDNLDAYSTFDAYKRISAIIRSSKSEIIAKLESITKKAIRYGIDAQGAQKLTADIDSIRNTPDPIPCTDLEQLPEIKTYIDKKNASIAAELESQGIEAQKEYDNALTLIEQNKYVDALTILLKLRGYKDSKSLIKKVDRYYLLSNMLNVGDKMYYFKKDETDYGELYNLYPTENGKVLSTPVIRNIKQIVGHFADIIYYLNNHGNLMSFYLSTNEGKCIDENSFKTKRYSYGKRVFLLLEKSEYQSTTTVFELDTKTGTLKEVINNIAHVFDFKDGKFIYSAPIDDKATVKLHVLDIDSTEVTVINEYGADIEGFVDGKVVYTLNNPDKNNLRLYVKELGNDKPATVIEHNIYNFCSIISGKLFYYIGNASNSSLINVESDGSNRREWPLFISSVLFEQGGWLYFIRKSGYNSVLCKSHLDGSNYSVIASDIDSFVKLKNGYLYYINDESTLVKVRMDGSNLQELCEDVESVLSVKDDKIVVCCVDGKIKANEFQAAKNILSIYAIDFTGSGKIKLAYNIKSAEEYDENSVFYVEVQEIENKFQDETIFVDVLYKIDVATYNKKRMLFLKVDPEKKGNAPLIVAIFAIVVSLMLFIIGLTGGNDGLSLLGVIGAILSIISVSIAVSKTSNSL